MQLKRSVQPGLSKSFHVSHGSSNEERSFDSYLSNYISLAAAKEITFTDRLELIKFTYPCLNSSNDTVNTQPMILKQEIIVTCNVEFVLDSNWIDRSRNSALH